MQAASHEEDCRLHTACHKQRCYHSSVSHEVGCNRHHRQMANTSPLTKANWGIKCYCHVIKCYLSCDTLTRPLTVWLPLWNHGQIHCTSLLPSLHRGCAATDVDYSCSCCLQKFWQIHVVLEAQTVAARQHMLY